MLRPFSRRELLRAFGLSAASLPMLDAMRNTAWAGGTAPTKRLVCIVLEHGVFVQHWLPWVPSDTPISTTSPGSLLQAPNTFLQPVAFEQRDGCAAIDLSPYTAALSPIHSAKWQALKSKTAFLNNLSCSNHSVQGHTISAMLGGYKNDDTTPGTASGYNLTGETLDVIIGRKLNGRLPLSLKCPDYIDDVKFLEDAVSPTVVKAADGTFSLAPALRNPFSTWDKLFADYVPPTTGPAKRDPGARRAALLERTLQNISKLKGTARLSSYDQQRLDTHAGILDAQRTTLLNTPPPVTATMAMPPPRPTGTPANSTAEFDIDKGALFRAQFANAAAALMMNKEQVITLNTGLENQWLTDGINLGGSQAYHANAGHLSNPSLPIIEECRKTQQLVFDAIADFLTTLDVVEDPASGATFLDNTLVLIVTEHDGRPNGHLRAATPAILAGGFGTFTGGKLYDYSRPALRAAEPSCIYEGFSHARLVRTVLQAFNVTATEMSTMDIQGEAHSWSGADLTDWTLPLPGLV